MAAGQRAWRGRSLRRLRKGHVASAVPAHAHIGLLGMGVEAFEDAQPRAIFADQGGGLVGEDFLIGAGLEELSHPQAAGVARGLLGRQRVVSYYLIVTVVIVGGGKDKQRAVVLLIVDYVIRV